jgi:large subunit ribosomal protein L6
MSRIGRLPVKVPAGVTVGVKEGTVSVKGPKGSLQQKIAGNIAISVADGAITFARDGDDREARACHGLMRALVANMVKGVTDGFEKKLLIEGTGFRAEVKGRNLILTLGFSHAVEYAIPQGIDIAVDKQVNLSVKGIDCQQVGQVSAVIRNFRRPDAYKGKGIRYVGENLRLKEGKTA